MSTIRLAKYADNGRLDSVMDAEFLRRKMGPDDTLDFSGVDGVTSEFLDALLGIDARARWAGRIIGATGPVADVLGTWQKGARTPDPAPQPDAMQAPGPAATVPEPHPLGHPEEAAGKYTPTRLVSVLKSQLTKYIEGAYPLSHTTLIKARRSLLLSSENGRLLAQDPFVETTPRYRPFSGGYRDLGLDERTAAFLDGLTRLPGQSGRPLLYPGLYAHQAEALQAALSDGRDVVVATGTGSGKTECFLLPMLGMLHREAATQPASFAKRGVRCLILYPMNALVNDQMARLRLLLGDEVVAQQFRDLTGCRHPTFGMYTGRTPYPGPRSAQKDEERVRPLLDYYLNLPPKLAQHLKQLGRYPAKDLRAFLAAERAATTTIRSGKRQGQTQRRHNWQERLHTGPGDRELLTRHEIIRDESSGQGAAPDVLVTNYSMLEYMLMRPFERPLFEETRRWLAEPDSRFLLVVDEAHMYRGAKGAEVACLIRRLLARLQLTNRPDKLACILTSASLGEEGDAQDRARRFAADLTGKPPGGFSVVFGQREAPRDAAAGDEDLSAILAAIDLDALHASAEVPTLRAALMPLLKKLGVPVAGDTQPALLRTLWEALRDRPFVNQLLKLTVGHALALGRLAEQVFPDSLHARRATEVLLTLGTIARSAPDEPGLLPTRIHMMFRGLGGLYACINPRCSGRQERPGETAPLGKLFAEPCVSCDACGARVLEMASCRDCGAAYLLGYAPEGELPRLSFLWGETEGEMMQVQLLAQEPRRLDGIEEISVQIRTGCLLGTDASAGVRLSPEERRSLWFAFDRDTGRIPEFSRCPVCQSRRTALVRDFTTRGEQSFTTLIETQFAEQPPQKDDPDLPNRGRKVLVFSDGRQKAARLAPALETSHTQDTFRQVLAIAVRELEQLGQPGRIASLYAAVLAVCHRRGINLFPGADQREFQSDVRLASARKLGHLLEMVQQNQIQPPLPFARALYDELTDRSFSLPAIGMGVVEEDPIFAYVFEEFPQVGLTAAEIRTLFRGWLRLQLERRCFLPPGATPGRLGDGFERPEGIRPGKPGDLLPGRFREYLLRVLGDEASVGQVVAWMEAFLEKGTMSFTNDQYYLQPRGLVLRLRHQEPWLRCSSCNRLHPDGLRALCYDCLGTLVDASSDPDYLDARSGYYRDQVLRALSGRHLAPFDLSTAEHSAQLTGLDDQLAHTKTEVYELRFQDLRVGGEAPIDVLSCTTTMEVGIDIGTLSGVALRNVPPHVANYQQRAGRAGRRGRALASVLTYAQGGSHDAYYYENPDRIITGDVRAPEVYIENQKVLERHVNAFLVQVFFHETVANDATIFQLFESLGSVEDFLSDEAPCSLRKLSAWLGEHEARLKEELRAWVPSYGHGLGKPILVDEVIDQAVPRLIQTLRESLPIAAFALRNELPQVEREALERQLEENLLNTLINRAIFPRYAFPTDTVCFWVAQRRRPGDPSFQRSFDYQPQRDLQIALSEYAPGSSLTIDKIRFTSAAIYSPYQPDVRRTLERARSYTACSTCGYVSLKEGPPLGECPSCHGTRLRQRPFVKPEGFAPDINEERVPDRGGTITIAGRASAAKLEVQALDHWDEERYEGRLRLLESPQDLVVVNKGMGDRGFMICPSCGYAEPVPGRGYDKPKLTSKGAPRSHRSPVEEGKLCTGAAAGPYFLGHCFLTDVLLLRLRLTAPVVCELGDNPGRSGRAGRTALTSLVEALCLAASRALQIDEGELSGNWNPVLGADGREVDLYLYDLLPGGAGYTRQIKQNLDRVLDAAEALLSGCTCVASCYHCLRHYSNQFLHHSLDRHLALALLRHLRFGEVPRLAAEQIREALVPLVEVLRLHGDTHAESVLADGVEIPLVVEQADGVGIWVDVHHPLVDPEEAASPVLETAPLSMSPVVSLDSHMLRYDPASAYRLITAGR